MVLENNIFVFNKSTRSIAAKICFFVFCMKMLISGTPIFANILDKGTVLQIVLQLEVELTAKGANTNSEDLHENGAKVFKPETINFLSLNPSIESTVKQLSYQRNEKDICSYHPSVPTPPPNC